MKRLALCMAMLISILLQSRSAFADNQPRDYMPAPPGTLLVLFYYNHTSADSMYNDGRKIIDEMDLKADIGMFRMAYYCMIGDIILNTNVLIPFGDLDLDLPGSGAPHLSATGVGDPMLIFNWWPYHHPESKTWLGFCNYFFFPVGDYDNLGALSLSSNQWRFREEGNFTKGFEVIPGHNAYLELTLAGDFFTDNDDFGLQSQTCARDPYLTVETHLSYDISKSLFASVDYYYHYGGETKVAGVAQLDSFDNHTIGGAVGFSVSPHFQVLVQYTADMKVESGPKSEGVLLRLMYAWKLGSLTGRHAPNQ